LLALAIVPVAVAVVAHWGCVCFVGLCGMTI